MTPPTVLERLKGARIVQALIVYLGAAVRRGGEEPEVPLYDRKTDNPGIRWRLLLIEAGHQR